MNKLRLCASFVLTLLAALIARAQNVASIDVSDEVGNDRYYVVLCGRNNTTTGHAFIVWGQESSVRQMSLLDGAFGLYPKADNSVGDRLKMTFETVPGEIADEFVKGSLRADLIRLIVRVNRNTYLQSLALKDSWGRRHDYQLLENDCVTFVTEVARLLKLRLPARNATDRPWTYVGKFIAENPQSAYFGGSWSKEPTGRFSFKLAGDTGELSERNTTGVVLRRQVRVVQEGNTYRVYRNNDAEVLQFLGFQPTLRQQIIQRGPQPSYFVLERSGPNELKASWFGLVVTKDGQANLQELKQPGSTPGTPFTLTKP
jgi:hypothetical protein